MTVNNVGTITTSGDGAQGIVALSVGGGGGFGATATATGAKFPLNLLVGGTGGAGGNGGEVKVIVSGDIYTSGRNANGVFAESVGGGGGVGLDVSGQAPAAARKGVPNGPVVPVPGGSGATTPAAATAATPSPTPKPRVGVLAVGSHGGSGGDGGNVTVIRTGNIVTAGPDSIGIIAQSVGGGGGMGGSGFGVLFGNYSKNQVYGGAQGATGTGGKVTIIQHGDIITVGDRSTGIFGQSVGGGGFGGSTIPGLSFAGSNGGTGDAQPINLTTMSNVLVLGNNSYGIFGQTRPARALPAPSPFPPRKMSSRSGTIASRFLRRALARDPLRRDSRAPL